MTSKVIASRAARLLGRFMLEPKGSCSLRQGAYRLAPYPDGTVLVSELGRPENGFADGGVRSIKLGREKEFASAGYQALGLFGGDQPLFFLKGTPVMLFLEQKSIRQGPSTGCADVTGVDGNRSGLLLADRSGRKVVYLDWDGTERARICLADLPYLPLDVCRFGENSALVALGQDTVGDNPVLPFALCLVNLQSGARRMVTHLRPETGGRNCWAVCRGPGESFFALGSGFLWKLDSDLEVIFRVELNTLCSGEIIGDRPHYLAARRTPIYFDAAFDGERTLYVNERNLFNRMYVFKVA